MKPRIGRAAARLVVGLAAAFACHGGAAGVPTAWADRSADEARALELFHRGEVAYREGRFEECVELLREARRLKRAPVLLYDLARAYEALGDLEEAARAYEGYLAEEPRATDRKGIEARIVRLRERARPQRPGEPTTTLEPDPDAEKPLAPPPPPDAPRTERLPGRVVVSASAVGLGVVGLGAGVFFGARATSRASDAEAEPVHAQATARLADARDDASRANVALVAGGALVGLGVLAWVLWPSRFVTDETASGPPRLGVRF